MRHWALIFLHLGFIITQASSQKQQYVPMRFAIKGKEFKLPCAVPSDATFLKWKFQRNGTDFEQDAAQVFPGNIPRIFNDFNTPAGRSELIEGSLIIHTAEVKDEGDYWCEISTVNAPTAYSKKYPVHVYVTPQEPQVTAIGNSTLTEHKNRTVARCTSQGGKPGAKLTWMNGTRPMSSVKDVLYKENVFKEYLTDGAVDLFITNPTRFDHKRSFSCVIEHPAYEGVKKVLNYTVKVMYHPINIRMWANVTSRRVYCEAEGFPPPTFSWRLPGGLTSSNTHRLTIENLLNLPGNDYFECVASNGILPNASIRATVDELIYPDGKPGWLGLDWWIWGAIFGGIAALVAIIVVIVCCVRHRKKASGRKKATKYSKPVKKPIINMRDSPGRPTTVPLSTDYRTPDGREDSFDSRTPSPVNEHKRMLVGGMYSKSQENITLIPSEELRRSRDNVFVDNKKSMHASMEQLDQVASHIQTLNKSWDQLSKSRQQLDEAQVELSQANPNFHQSREELYHSREALNRDTEHNYPYIDDEGTRSNENYYPDNDNQYYRDEQDGYRAEPQGYDYRDQGYDDRRTQGYDDGYGRQGYDTYPDDRRYDSNQRDDRYGRYQQKENSGYGNGYDDRQDYRYRDEHYRQNDGYNSNRIV